MRARELLETFGLWEKRDVKVESFSMGMRRRLSIAMVIIHKPTLERLKRAFQRVQSAEVALEPDGQLYGDALAGLPGVTTSVKRGDKWRRGFWLRCEMC